MPRKSNEPVIIWENNKVIGEVPMSEKTKMVVCVSVKSGVKYLNFRQFYQRRDLVWKPALNGFCMGIDVPHKEGEGHITPVPAFLELINKALVEAETLPIYDEANLVWSKPKEDK